MGATTFVCVCAWVWVWVLVQGGGVLRGQAAARSDRTWQKKWWLRAKCRLSVEHEICAARYSFSHATPHRASHAWAVRATSEQRRRIVANGECRPATATSGVYADGCKAEEAVDCDGDAARLG